MVVTLAFNVAMLEKEFVFLFLIPGLPRVMSEGELKKFEGSWEYRKVWNGSQIVWGGGACLFAVFTHIFSIFAIIVYCNILELAN